jgi:hypothetical protein
MSTSVLFRSLAATAPPAGTPTGHTTAFAREGTKGKTARSTPTTALRVSRSIDYRRLGV